MGDGGDDGSGVDRDVGVMAMAEEERSGGDGGRWRRRMDGVDDEDVLCW